MSNQDLISPFKSKSGLNRIFFAFFYSVAGLRAAWKNEHAFRQELMLALVGTGIALVMPISVMEKFLLIAMLVLVLVVELINSAIEAVVDRISLDKHPLSKNAKDFGSAAVLLTLCLAASAWGIVLWRLWFS